jgi:hypothetical protein
VIVVLVILFAASRDALAKYYDRTGLLLGHVAEKELLSAEMFNGNDHGSTKKSADQVQPAAKPEAKPVKSASGQSEQAKSDKANKSN